MTNLDKNWKAPGTDDKAAKRTKNYPYHDFSGYKPYNGIPCRDGERLVPFMASKEDLEACKYYSDNFVTWRIRGNMVKVGFTPVKEALFDDMLKDFYHKVHEVIIHYETSNKDYSLDKMWEDSVSEDNNGYDPSGTTEAEDKARAEMGLEMLISYYNDKGEPQKTKCIRMLVAGVSKGEIHKAVFPGLKKSRAYEIIDQTQTEGYLLYR